MNHQVIIRDDDMNATTPLLVWMDIMSPFIEAKIPVSISIIPEVALDIYLADGTREGFLFDEVGQGARQGLRAITRTGELTNWLRSQSQLTILQHGCHHSFVDGFFEFHNHDKKLLLHRLLRGKTVLNDAGLKPFAFVPPQDELSREALAIIFSEYEFISARSYEFKKMPLKFLGQYIFQKRVLSKSHYKLGNTICLTHPGCFLDPACGSAELRIKRLLVNIRKRDLSIVVVHHWQHQSDIEKIFLRDLCAALINAKDIDIVSIQNIKSGSANNLNNRV